LFLACPNTFSSASDFLALLYDPEHKYSDVEVVSDEGGEVFHAHKLILTIGSEYFGEMLTGRFSEGRERRIVMRGVSEAELKMMIESIYGDGRVRKGSVDERNAYNIFLKSNQFLFRSLQAYAETVMTQFLDEENVFVLLGDEIVRMSSTMKRSCLEFISKRYESLQHQDAYKQLPTLIHLEVEHYAAKRNEEMFTALIATMSDNINISDFNSLVQDEISEFLDSQLSHLSIKDIKDSVKLEPSMKMGFESESTSSSMSASSLLPSIDPLKQVTYPQIISYKISDIRLTPPPKVTTTFDDGAQLLASVSSLNNSSSSNGGVLSSANNEGSLNVLDPLIVIAGGTGVQEQQKKKKQQKRRRRGALAEFGRRHSLKQRADEAARLRAQRAEELVRILMQPTARVGGAGVAEEGPGLRQEVLSSSSSSLSSPSHSPRIAHVDRLRHLRDRLTAAIDPANNLVPVVNLDIESDSDDDHDHLTGGVNALDHYQIVPLDLVDEEEDSEEEFSDDGEDYFDDSYPEEEEESDEEDYPSDPSTSSSSSSSSESSAQVQFFNKDSVSAVFSPTKLSILASDISLMIDGANFHFESIPLPSEEDNLQQSLTGGHIPAPPSSVFVDSGKTDILLSGVSFALSFSFSFQNNRFLEQITKIALKSIAKDDKQGSDSDLSDSSSDDDDDLFGGFGGGSAARLGGGGGGGGGGGANNQHLLPEDGSGGTSNNKDHGEVPLLSLHNFSCDVDQIKLRFIPRSHELKSLASSSQSHSSSPKSSSTTTPSKHGKKGLPSSSPTTLTRPHPLLLFPHFSAHFKTALKGALVATLQTKIQDSLSHLTEHLNRMSLRQISSLKQSSARSSSSSKPKVNTYGFTYDHQ
jgi:hypothetical protein